MGFYGILWDFLARSGKLEKVFSRIQSNVKLQKMSAVNN